jgi:DNA-binding transcriptional MerR regulator
MSKQAVSITEMSKMVGLSRQRFNQLIKEGVFPSPSREESTGRPYFNSEQQQQCVTIRQTNTGYNGKPILFYTKRKDSGIKRKAPAEKKRNDFSHVLAPLEGLGRVVSNQELEAAMKVVFPDGVGERTPEAMVPALMRYFRSKDSGDSEG